LRPEASSWDRPIVDAGGDLAHATFAEMPARIRGSHAGLSIRRPDHLAALAGCAPIKLAEFLATGRPVVVNAKLGDMDDLVARHKCGVVLTDRSDDGLERGAHDLNALLADDGTPNRCRAAAVEHFSLETGIERLLEVYRMARAEEPE
jgi:glycosyltransferase involved in cell wall biosynthesis